MPDQLGSSLELPKQAPPSPEESSVEADEKAFESLPEAETEFLEKAPEAGPVTKIIEGTPTTSAPATPVVPKDQDTLDVEKILEEDLGDLYGKLPESARPKFKEKGEAAAVEIAAMVRTLKIDFKRALQLIRDWLLTIPGINKFFLEQEAKIKVDKLNELIEMRKEESLKRP